MGTRDAWVCFQALGHSCFYPSTSGELQPTTGKIATSIGEPRPQVTEKAQSYFGSSPFMNLRSALEIGLKYR